MNRMNRIVSLLSSLAVMFLAIAMAVSFCRSRPSDADRNLALRPAPSAQPPRCLPRWMHDCAGNNECIA